MAIQNINGRWRVSWNFENKQFQTYFVDLAAAELFEKRIREKRVELQLPFTTQTRKKGNSGYPIGVYLVTEKATQKKPENKMLQSTIVFPDKKQKKVSVSCNHTPQAFALKILLAKRQAAVEKWCNENDYPLPKNDPVSKK